MCLMTWRCSILNGMLPAASEQFADFLGAGWMQQVSTFSRQPILEGGMSAVPSGTYSILAAGRLLLAGCQQARAHHSALAGLR